MSILRKIVEKKKCERYAWPEGWMTREQAANDLGVPPREVDEVLKEAVRDGEVEKSFFQVYDPRQGKVSREPGYRVKASANTPTPAPPPTSIGDIPAIIVTRILANIGKYPGKPDSYVAKFTNGATKEMVAAVRATQSRGTSTQG